MPPHAQGRPIHITDPKVMYSFTSGDELTLMIQRDSPPAASASARSSTVEPKPTYVLNGDPTYTVLNSVIRSTGTRAPRDARSSDVRSVVVMRLIYDDSGPDYCSKSCVRRPPHMALRLQT